MDRTLTLAQINFCAVQCENQKVGPREVMHMCEAFQWAYETDRHWFENYERGSFKTYMTRAFVERLGYYVEPLKNEYGFRKMPVYFNDPTRQALSADLI